MAANLVDVMRYFELSPAEFRPEWAELSDTDKQQLKAGVGDGSQTY